jgi:Right handed beta helix region
MKRSITNFLLLGVIVSLVVAIPFVDRSQASTWRVERDGSGDFSTIQPAVDVSAPGDTILIGPGNYTEAHSVQLNGFTWPTDVFVDVLVGDLTFIGSDANEVIIGPDEFYSTYQGPITFNCEDLPGRVRIENVTMKNVRDSIFSYRGRVEIVGCRILNNTHAGIGSFSPDGVLIDQCYFEEMECALLTYPPFSGVTIRNSEMINSSIRLQGVSGAVVENCRIVGGASHLGGWSGIKFSNASGIVSGCEIIGHISFSIGAINSSVVEVNDCSLIATGLANDGAGISAWSNSRVSLNNCIVDGGYSSFDIVTNAQVTVHNSHIEKSGLWYVHFDMCSGAPIDLDFTNNYWGTTDLEEIALGIWDATDTPNILSPTVVFDPIADGPVSTTNTSLGALKAMFR